MYLFSFLLVLNHFYHTFSLLLCEHNSASPSLPAASLTDLIVQYGEPHISGLHRGGHADDRQSGAGRAELDRSAGRRLILPHDVSEVVSVVQPQTLGVGDVAIRAGHGLDAEPVDHGGRAQVDHDPVDLGPLAGAAPAAIGVQTHRLPGVPSQFWAQGSISDGVMGGDI